MPTPTNKPLEHTENIHDKAFKEVFSHAEQAKDFIVNTFPPDLVKKLDFNEFKLDTTAYVDEHLGAFFSDIVYNCLYNGATQIKISLLFEHKSNRSSFPHIQLLRYILCIWETNLKSGERPMIVIPILFYHGKKGWLYRKFDKYFKGIDKDLLKYIPMFDYIFVNAKNIPYENLVKEFRQDLLKIYIYIVKYMYDRKEFDARITDFIEQLDLENLDENATKLLTASFIYLMRVIEGDPMKIIEKMSKSKAGKIAKTAGEILIERGMDLGMEKGIEKGMEKGMEKGEYLHAIDNVMVGCEMNMEKEIISKMSKLNLGLVEKIIQLIKDNSGISKYDIYDLLKEEKSI